MERSHTVTDPNDPSRCEGGGQSGQCWRLKAPGDDHFCIGHGGRDREASQDRRLYALSQPWLRDAVARYADSPDCFSLREDMALIRVAIQTSMQSCDTPAKYLANLPQVASLLAQAERIAKAGSKIELDQSLVLSKAAILALGQEIGKLIASEIKGKFVGWESSVDRIMGHVVDGVVISKNEEPA